MNRFWNFVYLCGFAYRIFLCFWKRCRFFPKKPAPVIDSEFNTTLKSHEEVQAVLDEVQQAGLFLHPDPPKNWDAYRCLKYILSNTCKRARILDVGAEWYSPLLKWLFLYGYQQLDAINPAFQRCIRLGTIRYQPGDGAHTVFSDSSFDIITCLSVIEHGMDPRTFLKETWRLLKPGGSVLISTDYWPYPIDTQGMFAYGFPVRIFTKFDISNMVQIAHEIGFLPLKGKLDFSVQLPVINWRGLRYTFMLLHFYKPNNNSVFDGCDEASDCSC